MIMDRTQLSSICSTIWNRRFPHKTSGMIGSREQACERTVDTVNNNIRQVVIKEQNPLGLQTDLVNDVLENLAVWLNYPELEGWEHHAHSYLDYLLDRVSRWGNAERVKAPLAFDPWLAETQRRARPPATE